MPLVVSARSLKTRRARPAAARQAEPAPCSAGSARARWGAVFSHVGRARSNNRGRGWSARTGTNRPREGCALPHRPPNRPQLRRRQWVECSEHSASKGSTGVRKSRGKSERPTRGAERAAAARRARALARCPAQGASAKAACRPPPPFQAVRNSERRRGRRAPQTRRDIRPPAPGRGAGRASRRPRRPSALHA
ncbi:MAG: hypothetical protein J3K34DRAFT_414984 [Monoraphidium minutum]|nr:MAG: hypothetical protein J3K34DRAFT_414984 [Monoraphidium minutum]